MRRHRQDQEQVIRTLLARLDDEAGDPTEAELRKAARLAAAEGRSPHERPRRPRPWRPLRLRWACGRRGNTPVATGLAFGVASWLTPTSSARTVVEGFGFLPATGWTVIQVGPPGLRRVDAQWWLRTSQSSPGDPGSGSSHSRFTHGPRGRPLSTRPEGARRPGPGRRLSGAQPAPDPGGREAGHVPDSRPSNTSSARASTATTSTPSVTFASEPTAAMFEKAEEQIARLVVAPAAITITVRPTIFGRHGAARRLRFGDEREGRREGHLQFKQCGLLPAQFRDSSRSRRTRAVAGPFETGVVANGAFRAISGGDVSNEVQVQKRVDVRLAPAPSRRFEVHVVERAQFWRKQVLIQRFHRGQEVALVKKLRLVNTGRRARVSSTSGRRPTSSQSTSQGNDDQGRNAAHPGEALPHRRLLNLLVTK